ncbi:MAG: helix-turn-helix domain-containing protein [Xenophilus sp.]
MTSKKRAILACLGERDPGEYLERGAPPYSASEVAEHLGLDLSNTAKALAAMERDGLLIREMALRPVWNAIAGTDMERLCACYWVAETMEGDRAAAQAWRSGGAARSEAALSRMLALAP